MVVVYGGVACLIHNSDVRSPVNNWDANMYIVVVNGLMSSFPVLSELML